jgi:5-methylcytosine-specific restriction endonuclease McrA
MTFPKPAKRRKPSVVKRGLREIVGKAEYQRRREFVWDRDRGICCLCGHFVALESATMEHLNGRGMGGSKRDDRPEACGIACWGGNNAKGSQSYAKYMELPQEVREKNCRGGL